MSMTLPFAVGSDWAHPFFPIITCVRLAFELNSEPAIARGPRWIPRELMDPYLQRPLTIHDLVLDPTLDPSPIAHSMPPKDRLVPGFAVLATGSLLGLCLALAPTLFSPPEPSTLGLALWRGRHMDVVLEADPSPGANGGGSGGTSPKPSAGLTERSTEPTQAAIPSEDLIPLKPSPFDLPADGEKAKNLGSFNPAGDGHPRAMGQGNGKGVGGTGTTVTTSPPPQEVFDHQLVPRVMPRASYRLKPGEKGESTLVVVEVTVEEDGHVSQVQPLSGPAFLYPCVCEAARQWRFELLALHGLKGPQKTRIRFTCALS